MDVKLKRYTLLVAYSCSKVGAAQRLPQSAQSVPMLHEEVL